MKASFKNDFEIDKLVCSITGRVFAIVSFIVEGVLFLKAGVIVALPNCRVDKHLENEMNCCYCHKFRIQIT